MGKTMVILAPYWKSIWWPPRVANFWDQFLFSSLGIIEHLCKVSCFLQKMNDSGDKATLAAQLTRASPSGDNLAAAHLRLVDLNVRTFFGSELL